MGSVLFCDFETRSAADLKEVGLDNYAVDPTTEAICMAWCADAGAVNLWTPGTRAPDALDAVEAGATVVAHNAAFELAIWNNVTVKRYGWPKLVPEQCECTQAMAYAMNLPASLEKAAAAVGIKQQKDVAGHRLMLKMCRPKTGGGWHDDPQDLVQLYEYCKQDVEVTRELYMRLVRLSEKERRVWRLDYKINRRGVGVDLPAVKAAAEVVLHEQDRLNQSVRALTDNVVGFTTEVARTTKWVRNQGVKIDGLTKADVLDALDGDLPDAVRAVLEIRKEAGRASTAKLNRILTRAGSGRRVRGIFQYHGAGTGRWAGRDIQPHNFPRPTLSPEEVNTAIGLIKAGKRDAVELLYGAPMAVIADCLRGMLVPDSGNDLLAGDFANIEGRMLAWLAGEEWKLQAFRKFDAHTGPDLYLVAAGKIYRRPPTDFDKKSPEREIGKRCELAFGYQGGVGAWRKFEEYATKDYVPFPDDKVDEIKTLWREAHPATVRYWYAVEEAASNACLHPGQLFTVGPKGRRVKFKKVGSFLWCGLPSGRAICYPYPKILEIDTPWGEKKDALTYMTVVASSGAKSEKIVPDPNAHDSWQRVATYGGKLTENVTQACARDILADAMLRLDAAGFDITMHVHDEVVIESNERPTCVMGAVLAKQMKKVPPWATDLPIAVETWRAKRYRK